MKSFKQYITEKRVPLFISLPYKGSRKVENITGLENPSPMETLGFLKKLRFNTGRFIVDKIGKLLVWDADNAIHQDVITGEGWDRNETTLGVMEIVGNMQGSRAQGFRDDDKDLVVQIFTPKGGEKKSRTLQILKKREGTVWKSN